MFISFVRSFSPHVYIGFLEHVSFPKEDVFYYRTAFIGSVESELYLEEGRNNPIQFIFLT